MKQKTKICPKCHQPYSNYPAISRIDNKTLICDKCGLIEALECFFKNERIFIDKNKRQD